MEYKNVSHFEECRLSIIVILYSLLVEFVRDGTLHRKLSIRVCRSIDYAVGAVASVNNDTRVFGAVLDPYESNSALCECERQRAT